MRNVTSWPKAPTSDYTVYDPFHCGLLVREMNRVAPATLSLLQAAVHNIPNHPDHSRIMRNENLEETEATMLGLYFMANNLKDAKITYADDGSDIFVEWKDGKPREKAKLKSGSFQTPSAPEAIYKDAFDKNKYRLEEISENRIGRKRKDGTLALDGLVDSIRTFGWLPSSVILKDERGTIISGNRRWAAVEKLRAEGMEIEPRVETVPVGTGDAADAIKMQWFFADNNERQDFTPTERAELMTHMRVQNGMSYQQIAEAMRTNKMAVKRALDGADPAVTDVTNGSSAEAERNAEAERVADLYNAFGTDTQRELAARCGMSLATFQRRLEQARELGLVNEPPKKSKGPKPAKVDKPETSTERMARENAAVLKKRVEGTITKQEAREQIAQQEGRKDKLHDSIYDGVEQTFRRQEAEKKVAELEAKLDDRVSLVKQMLDEMDETEWTEVADYLFAKMDAAKVA